MMMVMLDGCNYSVFVVASQNVRCRSHRGRFSVFMSFLAVVALRQPRLVVGGGCGGGCGAAQKPLIPGYRLSRLFQYPPPTDNKQAPNITINASIIGGSLVVFVVYVKSTPLSHVQTALRLLSTTRFGHLSNHYAPST